MLKAGMLKVTITPPIGTPMAGFGARKGVSQGIHDELHAGALVLEAGETVALLTTDLIGVPDWMVAAIREKASSMTGIPPDHIMVAASHTHAGPDTGVTSTPAPRGPAGEQCAAASPPGQPYLHCLVDQLAGAICGAWKSRREAQVGVGVGEVSGIGVNRRSPDGLPVDPRVGVLRVDLRDAGPLGLLAHYTCHAVVLGPDNLLLSADYPGCAQALLERVGPPGFVAMFAQGAAGDVNTGHSADLSALGCFIPGRTFERAQKLGARLAGEVLKVYSGLETSAEVSVAAACRRIRLPLKPLPPLAELEQDARDKARQVQELSGAGADEPRLIRARVDSLYADLLVKRARERAAGPEQPRELTAELQAMRIGGCVLLSFPGELFVEIGLGIQRDSPFQPTFVLGYTSGYIGYLPTAAAFDKGGYEAVSARFGRDSEQIVVRESLTLLRNMP